ncbi:MAG: hypothetical protein CL878_04260 [Dehalococcoidia bacterium]|nr:hypothetical protein [Dehalococcoidia bacterium]
MVLAGLWYSVWRPMVLASAEDLAPALEARVSTAATVLREAAALVPNARSLLAGRAQVTSEPWAPVIEIDGRMVRLADLELSLEAALVAAGHTLSTGDRVFLANGLGERVAALPLDIKLQNAMAMLAATTLNSAGKAAALPASLASSGRPIAQPTRQPLARPNFAVQRAVSFSFMDGGLQTTLSAAATTVGEALRANGVVIHPEDHLTPDQMMPLSPGLGVRLVRAKPIRISGKDFVVSARTHAPTVQMVLAEAGVTLGPLDRVEPALTTPVTESTEIRVVRVHQYQEEHREVVPFEYRYVADPNLPLGLKRRVQDGSPGALARWVEIRTEDGQVVNRTVVDERMLVKPRADVVSYGTLSLPGPLASLEAATRVVPGYSRVDTDTLSVRAVMNVESTGYEAGPQSTGKWPGHPWYGITSIGWEAVPGIIAVDPRVIPYGTRLYVPGYGFGIAGDTGGAIVGRRIDLFYHTVQEALRWGRRIVPAYILE